MEKAHTDDDMLKPDAIVEGSFWPEALRVLRIERCGDGLRIEAVGTKTRQFYDAVLSLEDLKHVRVVTDKEHDFGGRSEAFFLFMEAQRIRYAHQFDPLFAVNVSQVDPLPHQIEAVYHYMLRQPRLRFLLADDPGAGKTIMTGLLLKELKYRGLVQRTLIVVPGHLKDQWLREMKERFGETFILVDRSVINATWGRNIWQEEPQVITSMDFAKQAEVMASLAEAHWDLVVVDEAHKMAAYRYGDKTKRTDRYRLGECLSRTSHFLLFLTATPHRGDLENFRLLIDLLHPGLFANTSLLLESVQRADNPIFLRRLKEDLKDFGGRPLFPPRHVSTITYSLNEDEKRLYNAVTEYVEKSYHKALAAEKRNVAFALLILQRRMASSLRAVRRSLENRKQRLEELLQLGTWLAERTPLNEEELEDAPEAERLKLEEELLERLTAAETREELKQEIHQLTELIRLAQEAERHEIETKLNELRKVLEREQVRQKGEKLLIFTESRETLNYLEEKLSGWGYSVVTLHGGMNLNERIQAEHRFRNEAQVMISTEAGGEGINLQFCALMVNYDIPWNPNRLEQRMGRIHRYGQQKEVYIYNLVAADTREGRVLTALFRKLEQIQKALGSDRVFDVIGEVVPGRGLQELIVEAIANQRTLEEIIAEIEAISNEEAVQKVRQAVREGLATRHIDLRRVLGEDRRARENRLVPEYIERFFERACRFLKISPEPCRNGLWRVPNVPNEIRQVSPDFRQRFGEVFRKYDGLAFDKETARRHNADFLAPGHPLLEAVIERLFTEGAEDVRRGAVFADPDGQLDGWLFFLKGEVRDGANQVAGKRLFVLYHSLAGEIKPINPSILWDLKPLPPQQIPESPPPQTDILDYAVKHVKASYRTELEKERERHAEIKSKYGLRSLEQIILESDAKLAEYYTRRAKGENLPEVEVINEQRRKEELIARKKALEETISREKSLWVPTPEVLGVVRVLPQPATTDTMHPEPDIEAIGMEEAMKYERQQGRHPEDVSAQNLGYDIRSTDPSQREGEGIRYIEVKARATTGPIALTPNEWLMAQRLGNEYWLYIVENAKSNPVLHAIQNPAARFRPEEITGIVRYVIKDWKNEARRP